MTMTFNDTLFTTTRIHNIPLGWHGTILLALGIWLANVGCVLLSFIQILLTQQRPNIYDYTKFFEGVVGYTPFVFLAPDLWLQ